MTDLELVGLAEVSQMLSVSKQAVANWRARQTGFPAPVAELKSGPVWRVDEIVDWAEEQNLAVQPSTPIGDNGQVRRGLTVAVVNMKGGVGKSTLTFNLGSYAA